MRAPNTLDGDQQVIEQAAPSATFVASPTFKEDGAADDGTLRLEGPGPEPMDVAPSAQDGGFWNFEAEEADN